MSIFHDMFAPSSPERATILRGSIARKTVSGEVIDQGQALGLPVYWAAIRAISVDIAKLPVDVMERLGKGARKALPDHPAQLLLGESPNPEMNPITFRGMMGMWAMAWGGGIAQIERVKSTGEPINLWPIHPTRVEIKRNSDREIIYVITNDDNTRIALPMRDVFHVRGLGDTLNGFSVLAMAAESIGLGLAAQKFGAAFFGNGASLGSIITHPNKIGDKALQHFRDSWAEMHQGASKAGSWAILEEGMTHEQLSLPPDQAQFLQTRTFQIEEFARWFRITPHKLQHLLRSSFNNIESLEREYVNDTLMEWLVNWEQEAKRKLMHPVRERKVFLKHNVDAILRGDQKSRAEANKSQWMIGAKTVNEIRALDDQESIGPEGDIRWVPVNMQPASRAMSPPPEPEPASRRRGQSEQAAAIQAHAAAKAYASANEQVVVALLEPLERKRARAVEAAEKKMAGEKLESWKETFAIEHNERMANALKTVVSAMSDSFQVSPIMMEYALSSSIETWAAAYRDTSSELPGMAKNLMDNLAACVAVEKERANEDAV